MNRFSIEEMENIFEIGRKRIVRGKRDHQRAVAAQMRLCRHSHGGVGYSLRKLCKRVARAGRNYKIFKRALRSEKLRFLYSMHDFARAQPFYLFYEVRRLKKSRIRCVYVLTHYRLHVISVCNEPF